MRLPLLRLGSNWGLFLFITCACLIGKLVRWSTSSANVILQDAISAQIQHGTPIRIDSIETSASGERSNQYLWSSNLHLKPLLQCPFPINKRILHTRLPYKYLNMSFSPPNQLQTPNLRLFNPTILPLPSWSGSAKYLVVSRVVTEGLHQESLVCLADFCIPPNTTITVVRQGARICTSDDLHVLGKSGGLRCVTAPIKLNIPPTPALYCEGAWSSFPDIPGFHDPRVFWSGKGEPLIILNSASQYGCLGLWATDLRSIYPDLSKLMEKHGKYGQPAVSYPHLTEITRNPRESRSLVEKNWMMWFPGDDGESYIQYDLGPIPAPITAQSRRHLNQTMLNGTSAVTKTPGRTFAKLIGNGFTTENLTSSAELPCFEASHQYDSLGKVGHWHQGSNSLKIILCTRQQARSGQCGDRQKWTDDGREVHFAIVHRKFSNEMDLPMRYERYVAVWEGRTPFKMLGISQLPILMQNEWARPWNEDENWPNTVSNWTEAHNENRKRANVAEAKSNAYFTYTPSLSWAWKSRADHYFGDETDLIQDEKEIQELSQLGTGFLGDDVLVGIGLDDVKQAFVKVKVDDLVSCLRLCPGAQSL
jgi:hypothetical protein